ncbi:MAG: hypothetical protein CSB24_06925 [Deltaproteobacteria bacterium]|nr:MAG: hypothetical protein CSB24_06925 [Deltaproteobacteria bacterium]
MKDEKKERRSFLKYLLAGSAAAAVLTGKKKAEARETAPAPRDNEVLYRESEAFRKYYNSIS